MWIGVVLEGSILFDVERADVNDRLGIPIW